MRAGLAGLKIPAGSTAISFDRSERRGANQPCLATLRKFHIQIAADAFAGQIALGQIRRSFKFNDFAQSFAFMTQIAIHAERSNHHPEWFNVYNRVEVTLTTHDCGGLSMKDIELARLMDQCAAAFSADKA